MSPLVRRLARVMIAAPLALGCGARSSLDYAAPDASPLPSMGAHDAPSAADVFRSSDAAPPPLKAPPPSHCVIGPTGSSATVAASNAGGVVSFVDERGTVTTPYTFTAAPPGIYRAYALIASRGNYIAAAVIDNGPTQSPGMPATSTVGVALLDGTGTVLFSGTYSVPVAADGPEASLVGNASGLFVLSATLGGVTFSPHGGKSWGNHYFAVADPDAAGVVLANDTSGNSTEDYNWFDANQLTATPTLFLTAGPTQGAAIYGTSLVYVTSAPPTAWIETPTGRTPVSQGNGWGPTDAPALSIANSAAWALACWPSATSMSASDINLLGGQSPVAFALSPPNGWSFLGPVYQAGFDPSCPAVDTQGDAFQFFSSATGIQAFRRENAEWSALGAPMGDISSLGAVESAGTYLLGGSVISGGPFLGPDGGAGVSLGAQMQVVRPASHASVTLPQSDWTNQTYPAYFMTEDGGCIAYFASGALTLADARLGVIHTTALTADTANDNLAIGWTNVPGEGQVWTDLGD